MRHESQLTESTAAQVLFNFSYDLSPYHHGDGNFDLLLLLVRTLETSLLVVFRLFRTSKVASLSKASAKVI